tara:strand:- start:180 stop:308 length:129 start_codon:yes stop_codon:yes gene_type:complete
MLINDDIKENDDNKEDDDKDDDDKEKNDTYQLMVEQIKRTKS